LFLMELVQVDARRLDLLFGKAVFQ